MKARLDGIYSPDLNHPEIPSDPKDFWVVIHADIGAHDSEGVDIFTFYFCSESKLVHSEMTVPVIVLREFSWEEVEKSIHSFCVSAAGNSWEELARAIGKHSQWEYAPKS